jgi:hypothetical protein
MEQNDLDLLYTVPIHHLQTLIKSRRLPVTPGRGVIHHAPRNMTSRPPVETSDNLTPGGTNTSAEPSSITIREIAQHLFNPKAIDEVLTTLGEKERLILHELVACGGRANSRDLALYLSSSGLLDADKENSLTNHAIDGPSEPAQGHPQGVPQYPIPHPHGVFELAVRHLLLLGLLFWGKQTNFGGHDYASGVYDGILIVPRAVMERDVALFPSVPSPSVVHSPTVSNIAEGIRTLQRTLYLYWSLVASSREGLPLVNNGLLSRQALRLVMEQCGPDSYLAGEGITPTLTSADVFDLFPEAGQQPASGKTAPAREGRGVIGSGASTNQEIRSEHEVPRLLFTRLLLMRLGLLREQQGTVVAPRSIEADVRAFFSLPLLERTRRCYRIWLETPFWNELFYLPEVILRPGPAPLEPAHEEVMQARHTVVAQLQSEQSRAWYDFTAFIAHVKLYAPYLLFPRRYGSRADRYSIGSNPYGWDFRLRRGWLTHREGWHLVEGGFIRSVIAGPLYWLGLVELNHEDNPGAFRLAENFSIVTSDEPVNIEEPAPGRLIIQPNFELVALAPVSEALLLNLDRFAERVGLERIAQYRLTKASVTRAIQMGLHAETIQQILEQASGSDTPQNVQYSLLEWERQARRVELWRSATLLEVDNPALLDTLFADEETRPLLGRRLAPTLLEVPNHQLPALQEALWQRDYLPALASAPDTLPPQYNEGEARLSKGFGDPISGEPQWRLHDDGLLEPLYAVLNLYLVAELERISEHDEETGWRRITPASLKHAYDLGLSLEYIMRFLGEYCEADIPNSFFIRLKLWGGGYEDQPTIHVEQAPLLALSSQVLADLQADEELGQLLGSEVAPQFRLVHVPADHLERVIELLRERGFEVT